MKRFNFTFSTKLTFDNDVSNHSFALRCIPPDCPGQHITACKLDITPFTATNRTMDSFGNLVISGYLKQSHRFLDFEVRGSAWTDSTEARTDFMPCYRYQSGYTRPSDALRKFYEAAKSGCTGCTPAERTAYFSDCLSDVICYEKQITNTKTTAAEAFALKKGVCQDFTHIMLSILRMDQIPCRYLAGLASCDGETHSWLEFWDGTAWRGYDPTNNCPVNEDYLMLSRGRDFGDCAIDRGVMFGAYTRQMQLISSQITAEF
ncbi:MAG: transglutaminase domain-containing protein [Ruminococcus sp.]